MLRLVKPCLSDIKTNMKKTLLLITNILVIFFLSCSSDETTVQIVRTPLLTFDFNATTAWKADKYSFGPVTQVVVYPSDTAQAGQLFSRFTLQGSGKDASGNTYQLIITFDAADNAQLTGVYSSDYDLQRGLYEVHLYNLTNSNNLSAYSLCQESRANAFLQIQKQNKEERLITGSFQMTLCNSRDTTEKLNITNGILKDIKY